jgi:chromosome segregation ATPase
MPPQEPTGPGGADIRIVAQAFVDKAKEELQSLKKEVEGVQQATSGPTTLGLDSEQIQKDFDPLFKQMDELDAALDEIDDGLKEITTSTNLLTDEMNFNVAVGALMAAGFIEMMEVQKLLPSVIRNWKRWGEAIAEATGLNRTFGQDLIDLFKPSFFARFNMMVRRWEEWLDLLAEGEGTLERWAGEMIGVRAQQEQLAEATERATKADIERMQAIREIIVGIKQEEEALTKQVDALLAADVALEKYGEHTETTQVKIHGMAEALKQELLEAGREVPPLLDELIEKHNEIAEAADKAAEAEKEMAEAERELAEEAEKAAEKLEKVREAILGNIEALESQTGALVGAIEEVLAIGINTEEQSERIKNAIQSQIDAYLELGQQVPPALQAVADELGVLSSAAEEEAEREQKAAEKAAEAQERAAERRIRALERVSSALGQFFQDIGPEEDTSAAGIAQQIQELEFELLQLGDQPFLSPEQAGRFNEINDQLAELRSQAGDATKEWVGGNEEVSKSADEVNQAIKQLLAEAGDDMQNLSVTQVEHLKTVLTNLESLADVGSATGENIEFAFDRVVEILEEAGVNTDDLRHSMGQFGEEGETVAQMFDEIMRNANTGADGMREAGNAAQDAAPQLEHMAEAAGAAAEQIQEASTKAANALSVWKREAQGTATAMGRVLDLCQKLKECVG